MKNLETEINQLKKQFEELRGESISDSHKKMCDAALRKQNLKTPKNITHRLVAER